MSCHRGPLARAPVTPRALLHSRCAHSARFRTRERLASTCPSVVHPPLPVSVLPTAATAALAWPHGRSFRHAFTSTQCSLDPRRLGYSPRLEGPRAARRLLQSRDSVSTPTEDPSPASSRQAVHPRSPAPGATPKSLAPAPTAGLSTGQGPAHPHRELAFGNPRRGDRSPHRGIDPNPIDPDTPVADS